METGAPARLGKRTDLAPRVLEICRLLDGVNTILIHCSAGMHRTGMIAYAILRCHGLDGDGALHAIDIMRPHTRGALDAERIDWAEALVFAAYRVERIRR